MSVQLQLLNDAINYYYSLRGAFYTYIWSHGTSPLIVQLKLLQSQAAKRCAKMYPYNTVEIDLNTDELFNLLSILLNNPANDETTRLTIQFIKEGLRARHFDYFEQLKRLGFFNKKYYCLSGNVASNAATVLNLLAPDVVPDLPGLINQLSSFDDQRDAHLHGELLITGLSFLAQNVLFTKRNLTWVFNVSYHLVAVNDYQHYTAEHRKALLKDQIVPVIKEANNDYWIEACINHQTSYSMTQAYAFLKPHLELILGCGIKIEWLLAALQDKKEPDVVAEQIHLLVSLDQSLITTERIKLLINAVNPSAKALQQLTKTELPNRSYEKYMSDCVDWKSFTEVLVLFHEVGIYKETNIAAIRKDPLYVFNFLSICKDNGFLDTPERSQSLLNIVVKFLGNKDFINRLLFYVNNKINITAVEHYKNYPNDLIEALKLFKTVTPSVFNILAKTKNPYETATQMLQLSQKHPNLLGKEMMDLIEEHPQDAILIIRTVDNMHNLDIFDEESLALIAKKLADKKLKAPRVHGVFNKNGKLPELVLQPVAGLQL